MVACVLACRKPAHHAEKMQPGCLALPPAVRLGLTAAPDGSSLYWLEGAHTYDYDGELRGTTHLVRYDLRSREAQTVIEEAVGPIVFLGGQLVTVRMRAGVGHVHDRGDDPGGLPTR